jgi:hypothetical protein
MVSEKEGRNKKTGKHVSFVMERDIYHRLVMAYNIRFLFASTLSTIPYLPYSLSCFNRFVTYQHFNDSIRPRSEQAKYMDKEIKESVFGHESFFFSFLFHIIKDSRKNKDGTFFPCPFSRCK